MSEASGSSDAYRDAVRRLGRRPYTRAELRSWLVDREHDADAIDAALERCAAQGWLDEAALAREYIVARARRLGYGPRRLIAELEARGVEGATAGAAWRTALDDGDVDLAAMLERRVRRKLAGRRRLTRRALARVYTSLFDEGFERDELRRALPPASDGQDDDDLA